MIKINIVKQSNYPIEKVKIKNRLVEFFKDHGIVSDADVSINIVGENKMLEYVKKYLGDGKLHNVLSFPFSENKGTFVNPPDSVIHLGEIVVCFPKAFEEAKEEGKLINEKIYELIEHSALHLLGIHHEE